MTYSSRLRGFGVVRRTHRLRRRRPAGSRRRSTPARLRRRSAPAAAAGASRTRRGERPPRSSRSPPRATASRRCAEPHESRQHRAERRPSGARALEPDVGSQTTVPRLLERLHQDERRELAEVRGRARRPAARRRPVGDAVAALVIVTRQSVTCQPSRPSRSVSRTYCAMCSAKLSQRLVDVERDACARRRRAGTRARAGRRGLDAQSDRREKRVRLGVQALDGLAGAERPLDADRRRLAERRRRCRSRPRASPGSPPSAPRRRARPRAPRASSSWRTLISGSCSASCVERDAERAPGRPGRARTTTDSSVGGAKLRAPGRVAGASPIAVADPDVAEDPRASRSRRPTTAGRCSRRPVVEDADRGHLRLAVVAEVQPVARSERARRTSGRRRSSRRPGRARS